MVSHVLVLLLLSITRTTLAAAPPPLPPGVSVCAPFNSAGAVLTTPQAQTLSGSNDIYASCTIPLAAGQMLTAGTTSVGGGQSTGNVVFYLFGPGSTYYSTYGYSYSSASLVASTSGSYTILEGCSKGYNCSGTVAYTIGLPPPPPPPMPPLPPAPPLPPGVAVCAPFNSVGAVLTTPQAQSLSYSYDIYASCTIPLAAGQMLTAGTSLGGGQNAEGYVALYLFAPGSTTSYSVSGSSYSPLSLVASTSGSYTILEGCSKGYSCSGTVAYRIGLPPPPPPPQPPAPPTPPAPTGTTVCGTFTSASPLLASQPSGSVSNYYDVYASCTLTISSAQQLSVWLLASSGDAYVVLCRKGFSSDTCRYQNPGSAWDDSYTLALTFQPGMSGTFVLYEACQRGAACAGTAVYSLSSPPPSPPSSPPPPPVPPSPPNPPGAQVCPTFDSAVMPKQFFGSFKGFDLYATCTTVPLAVGQVLTVWLRSPSPNALLAVYSPGYVVGQTDPGAWLTRGSSRSTNYGYPASLLVATAGAYVIGEGCSSSAAGATVPCAGTVVYTVTAAEQPPPSPPSPPALAAPPTPPLAAGFAACPAFPSSPSSTPLAEYSSPYWNIFSTCQVALYAGQQLNVTSMIPFSGGMGWPVLFAVYPPTFVNSFSTVVLTSSYSGVLVAPVPGVYTIAQGCWSESSCSGQFAYQVTAAPPPSPPSPPSPPNLPTPPTPPTLAAPPFPPSMTACSTPFSSATTNPPAALAAYTALAGAPVLASCNITVQSNQMLNAWVINAQGNTAEAVVIDLTLPAFPLYYPAEYYTPGAASTVVLVATCEAASTNSWSSSSSDYDASGFCGGQLVYTLTAASYPPPSPPSPPMVVQAALYTPGAAFAQCAPYASGGTGAVAALSLPGIWDGYATCSIYLAAGAQLNAGTYGIMGAAFQGKTLLGLLPPNYASVTALVALDPVWTQSYSQYLSYTATASGIYTLIEGCAVGAVCSGTVAYTITPTPVLAANTTAISAALTIGGYTLATFGTAQATGFKAVVGAALNVNASAVYITAVTASTAPASGRHRSLLVTSGVNVAFTAMVTGATPPTSASAAASLGAISAATLQSGGLTACTAIAVSVAPSLATPSVGAPPPADVVTSLPVTFAPPPPPAASVTASAPARAASIGVAALCAASSLVLMLL